MAMSAQLWSVNGAAAELGRDRRTIAKALDGIPADGDVAGRPAWLLATILRALEKRSPSAEGELDPAHERARKDRALADRVEMENELRRGGLVEVSAAIAMVAKEYGIVRTRLLGIPSRVASRVPESVRAMVNAIAAEEVREALAELSEAKIERK